MLLEQEEIIWVQRARANCLKHGDRNTIFFNKFASSQKKKNTIKSLVDNHGVRQENKGVMCSMVKEHFSHLFTSHVAEVDMSVMSVVHRKVALMALFLAEEVKKVLISIGDLKVPRPDRLHAFFYKRFLSMLGGRSDLGSSTSNKFSVHSRGME